MTAPIPALDEGASCESDRSCRPESGCCVPSGVDEAQARPTSRRGLKAGVLAAVCAVACLAGPLAIGGLAAAGGALAGEWWIVVAVLAASGVVAGVILGRRGSGGRVC